MEFVEKLKDIKILGLDVDGLLTDGKTWQDNSGVMRRNFSVRDAMGIRHLRKHGYKVAIITSISSPEVTTHFERLQIDFFLSGCTDKAQAWQSQLLKWNMSFTELALGLFEPLDTKLTKSAGFSWTVPTAAALVRKQVDLITRQEGGEGAVHEVCTLIQAQGCFAPSKLQKTVSLGA